MLVELLLCGLNSAELQPEFVRIHADAARRVGATDDEVLGAVLAAIPVMALFLWLQKYIVGGLTAGAVK